MTNEPKVGDLGSGQTAPHDGRVVLARGLGAFFAVEPKVYFGKSPAPQEANASTLDFLVTVGIGSPIDTAFESWIAEPVFTVDEGGGGPSHAVGAAISALDWEVFPCEPLKSAVAETLREFDETAQWSIDARWGGSRAEFASVRVTRLNAAIEEAAYDWSDIGETALQRVVEVFIGRSWLGDQDLDGDREIHRRARTSPRAPSPTPQTSIDKSNRQQATYFPEVAHVRQARPPASHDDRSAPSDFEDIHTSVPEAQYCEDRCGKSEDRDRWIRVRGCYSRTGSPGNPGSEARADVPPRPSRGSHCVLGRGWRGGSPNYGAALAAGRLARRSAVRVGFGSVEA